LCHAASPPIRPHTFEENIAAEKAKLEAQIETLKPGTQMDALRKKIRQLDILSHLSDWLWSPGLQPLESFEPSMPATGGIGTLALAKNLT
jgi:hypothetical protein